MKHMVAKTWNKDSRMKRVEQITRALSSHGMIETKYYKGRSYPASRVMGEGKPNPVDEEDRWNQAAISFQGKDAIRIFDSSLGPDIKFFDENFDESQANRIMDILFHNGILTWNEYLSQNKAAKPLLVFLIGLGLAMTAFSFADRDFIGMLLFLCMSISFILYFAGKFP